MSEEYSIIDCRNALRDYCKKDQKFNIFKVLCLEDYEIRHSNFLAWLLAPTETHGLKNAFLEKFVKRLSSECGKTITFDVNDNIKVYREYENIDILILNETKNILILIENKIDSNQHDEQLKRYKTFIENNLSEYCNNIYVYLKPEKNEIIKDEYIYITYKVILSILDEMIESVTDKRVQYFLSDYRQILKERYSIVNGKSLMDICLTLQQNNVDLSAEERDIVLRMAEQRRYDIMKFLAEVLETKVNVEDVQHKIYKILFKIKSENNILYEFDNTNTKNNSQIKFIRYKDNNPEFLTLFFDNDSYDKIFYTYGADADRTIKDKISKELDFLKSDNLADWFIDRKNKLSKVN